MSGQMPLPERLTDEDRKRLYALGFTQEPDKLAGARGLVIGLTASVPIWVLIIWAVVTWT